jgi:alanine dehydrogenase
MIVGIPKEIKSNESRVSMLPFGIEDLVKSGHTVLVEKDAGLGSGFSNQTYKDSGAKIIHSAQEIYQDSDLIIKVKEPQESEYSFIKENQMLFTYFHFAAEEKLLKAMQDSGATSIAYETVQDNSGKLPLLIPMSEVAGRLAIINGSKCLESNMGGKGKLISGVSGVEAANVLILGGGIVGSNAARLAAGLGANVYILDINHDNLRYLDDTMPANVHTIYSNRHALINLLPKIDLLVGAVLVVGAKAPKLIDRELLSLMDPGSVVVDVSVDQGGCIETTRPTTHQNPTFIEENVTHYCVANMPGSVPFTSTTALCNATFRYIKQLASNGVNSFKDDPILLKGLNTYKGNITHPAVAESFNLNYTDPLKLL